MSDGITPDQLTNPLLVSVFLAAFELNHAEIQLLPTAGFDLIPAPGLGKVILGLDGIIEFNSDAGLYTNIATTDVGGITAFFFQTAPSGAVLFGVLPSALVATGLQANNKYRLTTANIDTYKAGDPEVVLGVVTVGDSKSSRGIGSAVNEPLRLVVDNYTEDYETNLGNFTGGHADNYIRGHILYTIIDV